MVGEGATDVTVMLEAIEAGDLDALRRLLPVVYDELRRLASALMANERPGQTLQPTALVHEAFLRLVGSGTAGIRSRRHFFNAAALVMRRILVDHARKANARRRGGGWARLPLDSIEMPASRHFDPEEMESAERAMDALTAHNPRWVETLQLRLYLGFTVAQSAEVLGVSESTIKNDYRFALAWVKDRVIASAGEGTG